MRWTLLPARRLTTLRKTSTSRQRLGKRSQSGWRKQNSVIKKMTECWLTPRMMTRTISMPGTVWSVWQRLLMARKISGRCGQNWQVTRTRLRQPIYLWTQLLRRAFAKNAVYLSSSVRTNGGSAVEMINLIAVCTLYLKPLLDADRRIMVCHSAGAIHFIALNCGQYNLSIDVRVFHVINRRAWMLPVSFLS